TGVLEHVGAGLTGGDEDLRTDVVRDAGIAHPRLHRVAHHRHLGGAACRVELGTESRPLPAKRGHRSGRLPSRLDGRTHGPVSFANRTAHPGVLLRTPGAYPFHPTRKLVPVI